VDANGCSISQLAPCAGPLSGGAWRNHGQYVAAVAKAANEFLAAGLITHAENEVIMAEAPMHRCNPATTPMILSFIGPIHSS